MCWIEVVTFCDLIFLITSFWDGLVLFLWQPLQIKSAVAVEGLKGYIYIEAYKQTHVKQVCK